MRTILIIRAHLLRLISFKIFYSRRTEKIVTIIYRKDTLNRLRYLFLAHLIHRGKWNGNAPSETLSCTSNVTHLILRHLLRSFSYLFRWGKINAISGAQAVDIDFSQQPRSQESLLLLSRYRAIRSISIVLQPLCNFHDFKCIAIDIMLAVLQARLLRTVQAYQYVQTCWDSL